MEKALNGIRDTAVEVWRRNAAWACVTFCVILSLYHWGPLRDARWLLIDDHEIVALTGAQKEFSYRDIPSALAGSEVGTSSTQTRFRPAYFLLRYVEVATWGDHPRVWYGVRIAIAAISAAVLAYLAVLIAGPLVGTAAVTFLLSLPFWTDLYARLGPAETYALLGLDLIAIAWFISRSRPGSMAPFALVALGSLIAIGCKENFLILVPFLGWLLWEHRGRESGLGRKFLLSVPILYAAWVAYVVGRRVRAAGHDIYAQDASAKARLELAQGFLSRHDVQVWLLLLLIGIIVAVIFKATQRENVPESAAKRLEWTIAAAVVFFLLYGTQYVYYFGKWPETIEGRYLIPGLLFKFFAALLAYAALMEFIRVTARKSWIRWGVPAFALFCMATLAGARWDENRLHARAVRERSHALANSLQKVYDHLRANPDLPLIVASHRPVDYEPFYGVERFIRAQGIRNPIAIELVGYTASSPHETPLFARLAAMLERVSKEGAKDFTSLDQARAREQCFSIGLSGPPASGCQGFELKW